MEFNARFFFVAIILSLVSGVFYGLASWLHLYLPLPIFEYSWFYLVLDPVRFVFRVILPFAVMYILSMKATPESVKPIMVSTFFGCWIGGVISYTVQIFLLHFKGVSYFMGSILGTRLFVIWELISTAFSAIFFVSLAAILFAHYKKIRLKEKMNIEHSLAPQQ